MATEVLEGTWEDVLEHADELKGRRVRLMVLDQPGGNEGTRRPTTLTRRQREMLALLDEWKRTPLSEEEIQVLDDFEAFRKEHPLRLRRLDLEEEAR